MTRAKQLTVIETYIVDLKEQHTKQDKKIAQLKGEVKEWEERVQRIKEL